MLVALAYLREIAYRATSGDSASRMLMHIVPVVVVYLMIAAGSAERAAFSQDPASDTPEVVRAAGS